MQIKQIQKKRLKEMSRCELKKELTMKGDSKTVDKTKDPRVIQAVNVLRQQGFTPHVNPLTGFVFATTAMSGIYVMIDPGMHNFKTKLVNTSGVAVGPQCTMGGKPEDIKSFLKNNAIKPSKKKSVFEDRKKLALLGLTGLATTFSLIGLGEDEKSNQYIEDEMKSIDSHSKAVKKENKLKSLLRFR